MALNANRPERVALLLVLGGFAVLTSVSALQVFLGRQAGYDTMPLWRALGFGAASWIGWAAVAPVIMRLGRRFDFARGRRFRSVIVHTIAALVWYALMGLLVLMVGRALLPGPRAPFRWPVFLREMFMGGWFPFSLLTYAAILGVDRAARVWAALRERELHASRLEAQAVRARLEVLAARLHPHFLFNTLHAVGALIDESPARARAMLAELGDLLREVLRESGGMEIPLRDELRLLQRFLDIEQIRFADRLKVDLAIAPETLDLPVPRFLLQPLVENALRHGLEKEAGAGTVRIAASTSDGRLRLTVWNDGPPLPATMREGIGLSATRERLSTRFGPAARVSVRSAEGGGVETLVDMPAVPEPLIA